MPRDGSCGWLGSGPPLPSRSIRPRLPSCTWPWPVREARLRCLDPGAVLHSLKPSVGAPGGLMLQRFSAFRTVAFWMVMLLLVIVLAAALNNRSQSNVQKLSYSAFANMVDSQSVLTMDVAADGQHVTGEL